MTYKFSRVLLLLAMLLVHQVAFADGSAWYFGQQYFKWMVCGDAEIELSIPVFIWDTSSNDGVTWGHIYVTPGDEPETELMYYAYDESRSMDKPTTFEAKAEGDFKVTNTTNGVVSFTRNEGRRSWTLVRDADDDDHHTAKIRWKVPYQWRGKKIGIRVHFRWDDRYKHEEPNYTLSAFECPSPTEATITLNEPMLAFEKSSAGYIMVPWFAQVKSLTGAKLRMVDAANGHVTISKVQTKSLTGYINIPMDRPYSSVVLSGKAVAADGTDIPGELSSSSIEVPMLHTPKNMTASMQSDGKVVLKWKVDLANYHDIMESDMFDVQRNMSGSTDPDDSGWTTIHQEAYEHGKENYEVVDSNMLERYAGTPVSYRVRRQATSFWGWVNAAKYAQVKIHADVALYGINNATVKRSSKWNDEEHVVDINFNMSGPEYDQQGRFILRSMADWEKFANMVNSGSNTTVNVIMGGDVNISSSKVMVGTADHPYAGTFDGNGNTLTVGYNTTEQYTAPFRYIAHATIQNLNVDGKLTSSAKFIGGLVAHSKVDVNTPAVIANCRVSATIHSTVNGDASNGGLVAHHVKNTLNIRDSRFDGELTGDNCVGNGGFVGWSDAKLICTRCLFAPTKIATKYTDCKTFARGRDFSVIYFQVCYYAQAYESANTMTIDEKKFHIIRTVDDWNAFRNEVITAAGLTDVNAILDEDITIETTCGTSAAPFRGIFDGNGHELNLNINSKDSEQAPFCQTKGATIKNLRVTGNIHGDIHTAGLVGKTNNEKIDIQNVHVSANIYVSSGPTGGPHGGGFIGHAGTSSVKIHNCLFDGKLTSTAWNDSYAGAFVGWSEKNVTIDFKNNLENAIFANFNQVGMNYKGSTAFGGDNTNYSAHEWGEMASAANRNATTQYLISALVGKLGEQWKADDDQAVPLMGSQTTTQGNPSATMTASQLLADLGSNWQLSGSEVVPVSSTDIYGGLWSSTVWDQRAKLQLLVKMHTNSGVETKVVDLSGNTDVLKKQQLSQELTRKCVEYSFEFRIIRANSPFFIVGEVKDTVLYPVKKIDSGGLGNYRFQNSNRITKLEAKKKQSSVELTWETSGGESDYFRVLRRVHTNDPLAAWTDTIANNLEQLFFEDKKVLVYQTYDYRVESVWQCEGTIIENMTCTGACETTGMIEGYLRLADGTAIAGDSVFCAPVEPIPGANAIYKTTSDETGYFVFKGLPFQIGADGKTNGNYRVWVATTGDRGSYTSPTGTGEGRITFGQNFNWSKDFNFYMDTYYVLSGNVFFRDTSIPVPGASFMLDGQLMHDASQQPIVTDTRGAFSLSIPKGNHQVQVVKKGHYFANDGYLENPKATDKEHRFEYNINKNVSDVFFWDSTTVMLHGRVVGGDVQGSQPLGKSLSKNNLGDSIKIVMQLEGDNASYLIRKQNDESVKSASYKNTFGVGGKDTTEVYVTRHTLTIRPDKKTGEYQVMLPPAKYKVTEVSAQGYATLFQQGKVSETVDLSFGERGDTCVYNRIYHAVPTVDVRQFNAGGERYFGVKKITANDNVGNSSVVNVWYTKPNATDKTQTDEIYSFGYPVFMGGSQYGFLLQACEKYYKNNNVKAEVDIVNLSGGKVSIKNALTTDSEKALWTTELDETGSGTYIFVPNDPTFVLTDSSALKSVSITLEYDNSFYDIKPFNGQILKGYVMAVQEKSQGRKTIVSGKPQLFDILRDPPGGKSSSYLEEGSKLSYGYTWDLTATLGLSVTTKTGSGGNTYKGAVAAPQGAGSTAGTLDSYEEQKGWNIQLETNFGMSWAYSYDINITERIQTSSDSKWVGAKADVFIGTTENVVIQDALAVRVIPDSMYQLVKTHEGGSFKMTDSEGNTADINVPSGTMKVLAKGTDDTGMPVYLVRDEVLQAYPVVKSTFAHTQHYIENELLPDLMAVRNSLLLPKGTTAEYAQKLANKQGYAVYISKVDSKDANFGLPGYYDLVSPTGKESSDSISSLNQEMYAWISMLAKNEEEKITAFSGNLVKRYDFDGATSINYGESFSTSANGSRYCRYPLLSGFGNVLDMGGAFPGLVKAIEAGLTKKSGTITTNPPMDVFTADEDGNIVSSFECKTFGTKFELAFKPIIEANFNDHFSHSEGHSKNIGFTLAASAKSSLTVDVYRTKTRYTYSKDENVFYKLTDEMLKTVSKGKLNDTGALSWVDYSTPVFSNFVFRTIGGVTSEPYEDERKSKWYQTGTTIDVATIPADKPRIWIDEPVVSNVPFDQPARFKLHFANETDYPERASYIFNYYLQPGCNPYGAKVTVEGQSISSGGVDILLTPCRDKNNQVIVYTKEIEVTPGSEFDYNDLTICLKDPQDASRVFSCKFSAHFVPTAGSVNVSMPGDKWVVNTESAYDGKRQMYYMPVRIDGFDTNYRGFDHIELQYKLSTQGEKEWVNVCSFYKDKELMAKASGVTDTIPSDGVIVARFYGESDPVEQHYDLRAVNYCRHANGFLTGFSPVLSGIKDTRRPTAFGTPSPTNGILGIGDDIKIQFSEPIAGNYLRKINNFEMLGTLNSNDISTSTSLNFNGDAGAWTQGSRNLTGKSFTVDVMLNPAVKQVPMTVFAHGGEGKGLRFGLTPDRHLTATVNGQTVVSDRTVNFNNTLHQVAYVLDQQGENMNVQFFDGSLPIGKKTVTGKYDATSPMALGINSVGEECYYGEMLEFRLWNRPMTAGELSNYGNKKLTGFESGLLDYYPLNEGTGQWGYDKAPASMDLLLEGTSWKRPVGISVKLKGDKGLVLKSEKFTRTKEQDYTLMFWFRTTDSVATIFSNGVADREHDNQLSIGVKKEYPELSKLYVRSSGFEVSPSTFVSDGSWHHFAMTVSRSQNVANIYVDKVLVESLPADSLQGIQGDHIALGATYVNKNKAEKLMTGNIDEVGMFASVLPVNLIEEYATHTPIGTMSALMAYLDFGRAQKQDNNTWKLEPTGISLKRYLDNQGKVRNTIDELVSADEVKTFADRETYAPMVSNSPLDNLNYTFVANDNVLYMNVTEPDFTVEKTNIYVTVKEVADLQGNLMASPITMNLYVYRNPLRWSVKRIEKDFTYGDEQTMEVTIKNLSGIKQNFRLEDLPVWITASQTSGTINALDEQTITLTVSSYINIGKYTEQVTLIGDNGMSEVLPITLHVKGEEPEWYVNDQLMQMNQTMMMVARVKIDGVVATSEEDVLAVFDENQQTLGLSHIEVNKTAAANEALAYLTIYGYTRNGKTPQLSFRFYQSSTGNVYSLSPADGTAYTFKKDAIIGTSAAPVVLENSYDYVQTLKLKKGWNWVTFNVKPQKGVTLGQFLNSMSKWEVGDKLSMVNGTTVQQFTCRENKKAPRGYKWDKEDQPLELTPSLMYNVYSMSDKLIYLEGEFAYDSITVTKGWNRIGYLSTINLPVAQALSDYTEQAQEGDVVKSQNAFAMAAKTNTGIIWKGSLRYIEYGKGYMMKRLADSKTSFYYPLYFNDNRYSGNASASRQLMPEVHTSTTMNIVATVKGIETQAADRLVVFRGAEQLTEAIADEEQNYYLTIGSDDSSNETLTFVVMRDEEIVATTGSRISYVANTVLGTPDEPTDINFTDVNLLPHDGKWYTVGGMLCGKKPTKSGVYIHNGKAVVIK